MPKGSQAHGWAQKLVGVRLEAAAVSAGPVSPTDPALAPAGRSERQRTLALPPACFRSQTLEMRAHTRGPSSDSTKATVTSAASRALPLPLAGPEQTGKWRSVAAA